MKPIEFLLLHDDPHASQLFTGQLPSNVSVEVSSWAEGWGRLIKTALYKNGPDLALLGGTWTSDLVGMAALRPFSDREVTLLGGAQAFAPAVWRTAYLDNPHEVWTIPWNSDTYVIYYWRDMLEKAGLDEKKAFSTPEQLENTLQQLQARGHSGPWFSPTHYRLGHLHCLVSWIWGLGGDLVSSDGKQLLFDRPQSLAAFQSYFRLFRFLHPGLRVPRHPDGRELLLKREVAVAIGTSSWLAEMERQEGGDPVQLDNLGVALPPGPAYVGESNLAIYQHSRYPLDAFEVVLALVDPQMQKLMSEHPLFGQLPVLLSLLTQPPYTTDPRYKVMVQALQTGRSYPVLPMWGMIETRLSDLLLKIEAEVLAQPEADLESLINPQMQALADRLSQTLEL